MKLEEIDLYVTNRCNLACDFCSVEARKKCSELSLDKIKDIIKDIGSGYALMSGSGSTIIYYIEDTENINKVYNIIKERLPDCKIMLSKMKTN